MQALLEDAVVANGLAPGENEEERRLRKRVLTLRAQVRKANDQPGADKLRARTLERRADLGHRGPADLRDTALSVAPRSGGPAGAGGSGAAACRRRAGRGRRDRRTRVRRHREAPPTSSRSRVNRPRRPGPPGRRTPPAAPLVVRVYTIAVKPTDLVRRVAAFREALAAPTSDLDPPARESLRPAAGASRRAGGRRPPAARRARRDPVGTALPGIAIAGRPLCDRGPAVAYGSSLAALAAMARSERRERPAQGPTRCRLRPREPWAGGRRPAGAPSAPT